MNTAVVILNWNGREFLKKFLPRVIEYSMEDAAIIVADNASTDDSVKILQEEFPQVKIIQNKHNYGFAGGYNEALKQVKADYYILLNSDIKVTKNWIKPLITFMEADPQIAACQPKLRSYEEPEKFEYAGAAGAYIDKYGYPFCRGRIFQSIEKDEGQYDDVTEVFWASGACMFIRANLFHQYGGFDEDFFAHMEEIDLCWRLKNEGYKIMYHPASTVYHIGGGTLPKSSPRKTYYNFRNNYLAMYKNLPSGQLAKTLIVRLILDAIAATKFLLESGYKDFFAVIRAHFSFYRSLPKTHKKRKMLKQNKLSMTYRSNIVFAHFVFRKNTFKELDSRHFSK